ncbi:MAG: trypsin-like peptidase domain-containing protein [Bacteroidia bacterium]|nr:trypsin-like peptidase domain-containing protein [Bacteroidia bacterium]
MFQKAIAVAKGSIFPIIRTHYKDGKYANIRSVAGTGFFIDSEGHFVTALHVVAGDPSKFKYGHLHNIPYANFSKISPEEITPIGSDPSRDLFVGKLTQRLLPPLNVLKTNPDLGSSILIGGYPFPKINKVKGIFRFNTVRQFWQPTMIMDYLNMSMLTKYTYNGFLVSHRTIPGMSGGPVIDTDGNVIGLCTASMSRMSGKDLPHYNGICLSATELTTGIQRIFRDKEKAI